MKNPGRKATPSLFSTTLHAHAFTAGTWGEFLKRELVTLYACDYVDQSGPCLDRAMSRQLDELLREKQNRLPTSVGRCSQPISPRKVFA
jgi:hypothetical protein